MEPNDQTNDDHQSIMINKNPHNDQILDILAAKSIKINDKFVVNMHPHKNIDRETKKYCKILKLSTDWNYQEITTRIGDLNSKDFPNLFIFIFEVENAELKASKSSSKEECQKVDQIKEVLNKFTKDRPIVLQLTSIHEKITKFYYKDQCDSMFVEIDNIQGNSKKILDFPLFMHAFLSGEVEGAKELLIEGLQDVENSALILRFFRILEMSDDFWIDIILKCSADGKLNDLFAILDAPFGSNGRILSADAQKWLYYTPTIELPSSEAGDTQDEQGLDAEDGSVTSSEESAAGSNKDESLTKTSVLLEAVQHSNQDIINYIISYWSQLIQELPFDHRVKISTAAFNTNQHDVLCDLINVSDFPFPDAFNASQLDHQRLNEIVTERTNFNAFIKQKDIQQISKFIDNNMSLRIVYNTSNKSALQQAIDLKKYEIYFHLKSFGFCGIEFDDIKKVLNEKELKKFYTCRTKQRSENVKKGLNSEQKSVNLLCNRSFIHNRKISKEKEVGYRKKIRKWFEDINKIEFGPELLNVAASCEELKIIFDFESETSENASLGSAGSLGVMYPSQKWIFIGAKSLNGERDQEVKGVLAHEVCHYVMKLVYENAEHPYYKHWVEEIKKFAAIVAAINKWLPSGPRDPDDKCDGIISSVFRLYAAKDFHPELIVRVVQILAQFDDDEDKSKYLQDKYKELFEYFRTHVLPEMCKFNLESREKIRKMNRIAKLLEYVKTLKLKLTSPKITNELTNEKLIIVTTNVPKLLIFDTYEHLLTKFGDLLDTKNVFVDPKVLNQNPEIFEDFKKLLKENSGLNIFVDCSDEVCDKFKDVDVNPTSHLLFVVRNTSQANEVKQNLPENISELKEMEINYNWSDLTTESQEQLLQTKINFQNNPQISLIDLITKNVNLNKSSSRTAVNQPKDIIKDFSEIIDDQLLNLLLEKKQIEVNKVKENSSDFQFLYQSRRFNSYFYRYEYSEDELLWSVKNEKYVLISDIAGNGKSWALKSISMALKHQNSTSWVTYVDLKQFIKEFKAQKDEKLEFSTFLIEKILKLKTDKFEAKIFQKMYEIGKVFIIFDGFDEIAPDYAEFVSKLAVLFEQNGGNQLWIATRDHVKMDLKKLLQLNKAYKLNEFSTENGVELIAKSWMLNEPETKKITSKEKFEEHVKESTKFKEFLKIAKKLIEKVSMSENRSIGMPQIYTIIAKISKDNKEVMLSFSQTKMYEDLVDILYERWSTQKGEIRNQANKDRQKEGLTFYKFHQYLAIKSLFFEYVGIFFRGYNGSEWPTEEVVAGGIVDINYGKINFLHETFREYFIADFLTKELKEDSPHPEAHNMFAKVMTTEKFGVIRMFLNDSLEKQMLQKIEPKMQTHNCMKMFEDMDSFADIFNRDLDNLIEFIKEVLKRRNGGNLSRILFNSACKILANPSQFSKFQDFLFTHCNVEFLEKLITEKSIFLNLIESRLGIENFEEFVTKMEPKVGREIVKKGLEQKNFLYENIFFFLCKSSNLSLEKFKLFLQLFTKFLTTEEIFKLMLNCDENQATILKHIFEYSNIREPLEIWSEIKNLFIAQNQENLFKKLVMKEDSRGNNILHYSFHLNLDQYKQFLEQMFELKILKEMIVKLNSYRSSFMHALMRHDEEDKIEHTLMFFELKFEAKEIGEFLKIRNGWNQTVLEVAVKNENYNCKIYKTLWQLLRKACRTDKEFLEIISNISQDSENILQIVAKNNSTNEVLEFMIEELDTFDACDEIRRLLTNETYPILLTILLYKEEHFELYKTLWKIYHKNFDLNEFLKIFKYQNVDFPFYSFIDISFLSFLPRVIRHKNKEFVEYTWNKIKSFRNQDELKIAHYLRRENWKNDLLKLSLENCPEVHNWVQNILKEYKIDFEIQIFPEFSEKFENCIKQKSHDQLEKLLKDYEKIFENRGLLENFKYFLMTPDSDWRNFVHRATFCDDVEINKVLWKRILNISDWNELNSLQKQNPIFDEILKMFTVTDWCGDSVLHSAVAYSTVEVFKLLIEILEALASKDEIKDILKSLQERWNLLNKAAYNNKTLELHVELWKFLEKYFNPQEIIEFLNKRYNVPLLTAFRYNTMEIFELTWNKFISFLDRDKQVEYLSENFDKLFDLSQKNDINRTQEWLRKINHYPENIKGIEIKDNDDDLKLKLAFIEKSLLSIDEKGNIFYYLCKSSSSKDLSVEKYLETLQNYLNPEKILNMMKNCNCNGENIFHICVRAGNGREFVKWLKGVFNFTQLNNLLNELNELLFQTNSNHHNFLDLSVDNNSIEFHKTIWDFLEHLLTNNEILNICVRKNENNFVHLLLQNNENPQIIEHIFNIFKSKLSEAEFLEVLNSRGHQGTNLLQTAVMNTKNIEIFKIVWNLLLDFYKTDFTQILTAVDDVGRHIISVAACHSSGKHFDLLIDYLKSKLSIIENKEMLFSLSTRQSSLHYAVCNNKDLTLHKALWTHFSQHFSEPEIKEIIKCVDVNGNNLLHCAVRKNSKEIVEFTWKKIDNYLDPNEQVEYLNATGFEGKNLYEMSLLNEDHPNVHKWVQNIIQTTLTPTSSISQLIK